MRKVKKNITAIENIIINPRSGLPEEIFLFISRNTPLVNVDLLIRKKEKILLTWRSKGHNFSSGWHIPGGIIRFKETMHQRLNKTAKNELGCRIKYNKNPVAINQIILKKKNRSHFISFLFNCSLIGKLDRKKEYLTGNPASGQWKWFSYAPKNLIKPHGIYRKYFI